MSLENKKQERCYSQTVNNITLKIKFDLYFILWNHQAKQCHGYLN